MGLAFPRLASLTTRLARLVLLEIPVILARGMPLSFRSCPTVVTVPRVATVTAPVTAWTVTWRHRQVPSNTRWTRENLEHQGLERIRVRHRSVPSHTRWTWGLLEHQGLEGNLFFIKTNVNTVINIYKTQIIKLQKSLLKWIQKVILPAISAKKKRKKCN